MTGMYAVQSVLVALWQAARTGAGAFLDCAMADAGATLVSTSALLAMGGHFSPRRFGSESPLAAPSGVFACSDGQEVQVVCVTERHWRVLCGALNRPEWLDDPGFADNGRRLANRARLRAAIAEVMASDCAAAWVRRISDAGAICEHVRDIEEAWADERLVQRGLVAPADGLGPDWAKRMPVVSLAAPRGAPAASLRRAPALGADTEAVARELTP
jgi:crotonobetainyl-CoA:carnitine CoA-transferase CaiB-like acyl-CoA transferase